AHEKIDVLCPGRITGVKLLEDHVVVDVNEEGGVRQLTCSLLAAADGARSMVRQFIDIESTHVDYRQCAIIGNVLPEVPISNRAFERFTVSGALSILPITNGRAAFVWCLSATEAEELMPLSDRLFTDRLQAAFGYRL